MKRSAILLFGIAACFLLFSCGIIQPENAPETTVEQTTYHGIVEQLASDLYPLDLEYNSALIESDGSRASLVGITAEYTEKWKLEIERYYDLLESYYDPSNFDFNGLNEEGKDLLRKSQQDWQKYCVVTEQLNSHLSENHEPTGGTKIAANHLKLYRDRAIELIMKCEQLGITNAADDVARLQNDLSKGKDLQNIADAYGVHCVTQSHGSYVFSLIRYDGEPAGLGTLERTWTFLRVASEGKTEVYPLYEQSAEYPLHISVLELSNGNQIIAIAGTTNISRSKSAFMSFWEHGEHGLKEFSNIILDTDYANVSLYGNQYYAEFFEDSSIDIHPIEFGLLGIVGDDFKLSSFLREDIVMIELNEER